MYISKKDREVIRNKFGGLCAYSGTPLEDDWQVDHIEPLIRHPFTREPLFPDAHKESNMVPCQKIINHYKGNLSLSEFRRWIVTLHVRLSKLPKNPTVKKSMKRKDYLLRIASYFGITPDSQFCGEFYFEKYERS